MKTNLKKLQDDNNKLKSIIQQIIYMASRYADGRSSYAPSIVNEAIMDAKDMGVLLGEIEYAKDGMLGEWDEENRRFKGEGSI